MQAIGFDNNKYLQMQSEKIRARISQFGGKLYLEFGGKLFDDYHAARVLPGFEPDNKIKMLLALREQEMIRIIAKQELRSVPFVGWVMEKFRIIFVRRGAHDSAAYESCVDALKNEHDKLLVFVEGTRCNKDKHVRPKTGAVRMALASGAPVVPVFVTRNRTPFCPVRVIFGEPYSITDIDLEDHVACQQAADALLKTIYQLGGDAYADQIGKDSGLLLRR